MESLLMDFLLRQSRRAAGGVSGGAVGVDLSSLGLLGARLGADDASALPGVPPMPIIEERVVSNVPRTLPMRLVHCNGGEEGPQYRTANALVADSSVYSSSARCNIHMLLQSTHAVPFTLTHVVVMAPDSRRFTCPIACGLVFVSMENDFTGLSEFDNYSWAEYKRNLDTRRATGSLRDSDPVAWFEIAAGQDCCEVKVDVIRTGRFALIKLLRSRSNSGNIDLQYVGLRGYHGAFGAPDARLR